MSKYQTKVDYNVLTMHHPEAGDVRRAEGSIEVPHENTRGTWSLCIIANILDDDRTEVIAELTVDWCGRSFVQKRYLIGMPEDDDEIIELVEGLMDDEMLIQKQIQEEEEDLY